ncbi:septin-like protein [Ordospora colligata]|uniref:Septin-like protein n=1 Tax=Ordospora colligata OC4 TaxID=1354746 RepID=A0A0B2UJ00_9MICR|nr:septin-like protein [Ordospora colligata OC4]KHN68960.1 septin-like protein [Ordospora colligata OC4]TBU13994.1 septin-like protein [Ordospora colligata]TBU14183.1 septin-like protein [Ordospora colligata]TBU17852.1 septin-like protein [Ordospora colligata]
MKAVPTIVRNLGTINSSASIGFSSVPDQVRERSIANGFELNILVAGRRALGTSTLINSIFAAPLVDKNRPNTITITKNEIIENNISLDVSIVTYHELDISPVIEYIDAMNKEYFENEQGPYKTFKDNRIHACLYVLPSDSLSVHEINNMHALSQKCNLVPVIPKADMYTSQELMQVKQNVKQLLFEANIHLFVPYVSENDGDLATELMDIIENMPFAVIASETLYEQDGDIIRGRKYPWGFINIDSEDCNDFKRLQRLLIYTNLDELVTRTNHTFYNSYRAKVFDLENSCGAMKEARYLKLRKEMIKILNEKYEAKINALKEEEAEMDRLFNNQVNESSGLHEMRDQIEKSLRVE